MFIALFLSSLLLLIAAGRAHTVAWVNGMYCKNGLQTEDNENAAGAMTPLFDLSYNDWFMHGRCRDFPPAPGEMLNLPAGGSFEAELSGNRAWTSLSYGGSKYTGWGDGLHHPNNYSIHNLGGAKLSSDGCLLSPNIHTTGQADAAGTVFAIAYESDMSKVAIEDFVVFTVAKQTPFMVKASYDVPADMPACPEGGCICAWGWVPNHCGQANEYMNGYRCNVTGARPDAPKLAKPKAPVWCEGEPDKCVKGAKMMVYAYQKERNTVNLTGIVKQADGQPPSPGYNAKMGWLTPGAQNDIFEDGGSASAESAPASTHKATSTKAPSSSPKPTSTKPKSTSTHKSTSSPKSTTHKSTSSPKSTTHKPTSSPKPTSTKPKSPASTHTSTAPANVEGKPASAKPKPTPTKSKCGNKKARRAHARRLALHH